MESSCKREHSCPSVALDIGAINQELIQVRDWILDQGLPNKISKEFEFKNFNEALVFVNKIGTIADQMNHHPDIVLKWGYVQIIYWTHNASGLTEMDFEAAKRINELIND
jgi:4a-hydroxytetrahydrobiopterin dehydratase